MTVGWHVDDFIIKHRSQQAIDEMVSKLNCLYGQETPLKVHLGKVHEYLGMTLDFTRSGKVVVALEKYVKELIAEAPEYFDGEATTLAGPHLFKVNQHSERLEPGWSSVFHHLVAKFFFLCKRSRPDFHLTVGLLCGTVKASDIDDWKKLRRLFQYLRATSSLSLTLEADENMVARWWVDASFAMHSDCWSQSGAVLILGKGASYSGSQRQKLKRRSLKEAERIAVDDFVGQVLATQNFLRAQGSPVCRIVVHQDK